MQLGSPGGYEPLRRYLLDRAMQSGIAQRNRRHPDHQRLPAGRRSAAPRAGAPGRKVAIEEPVYPGLKNLFLEAGADLIGVP
jgi:2-aminoadipate transaminase